LLLITVLWVIYVSLNWIYPVQKACVQILSSQWHNEAWFCKTLRNNILLI
jgi:hypothetical protein